MSIDRLGSVDPLSAYSKAQKSARVATRGGADSIQVSDEARQKAELLKLTDLVRNADDVRLDRIEEVKRKLEDPSYIDETVLGGVADKLMEAFGIE